ncbi:phosphoribosylformylglycinamidine synthase subunit PurS [Fodinisporobacter ferrooxydans]|uniref:Phosphoribosylformylglycinamidine synthase subunit PurS n=1 Tax=Fodinisporobacter ferrooxydans TaxID=2901836 RepID=A0ABY4CPA7_9BACL|nr:phosphoribosylformylglycinamidine synthase subunit PurS [Alicyclobacillaceae bacterium MYW30-H2]
MILAKVYVTLKESVLDPQGTAVQRALQQHGYDEVQDVRIGKYMEVRLNLADKQAATERITAMCEELLANLVIESYRFELFEVNA